MSDQNTDSPVWDRKPAPKRKSTWWALVIGLVVLLFFFLVMLPGMGRDFTAEVARVHTLPPEDGTAQLIGYTAAEVLIQSLFLAVPIWAVIYFAFVRARNRDRGMPYFLTLLAVPAVLSALYLGAVRHGANNALKQDDIARQSIGSDLKNLKGLVNGETPLDSRVHATGSAGEAERIIKTVIARQADLRRSYHAELQGVGFFGVFQAVRLGADPGLRRTRATLSAARQIEQKYRGQSDHMIDDMRAMVQNDPALSDAEKKAFVAGADRGYAEQKEKGDRIWSFEDGILDDMQDAVVVLVRSEGRWTVRGGRLLFINPGDRLAYNAHIEAAKAKANEQKVLMQAMFDDAAAKGAAFQSGAQ